MIIEIYNLVRFLYILEQQYQSDSPEVRTKTREDVEEYIGQFRQSDDIDEDDNDDQETDQLDQSSQPAPIGPLNPVTIF